MERSGLIDFINQCEDKGVTFVATETAAPSFSVLAADPRVCLITCLREPLARFMSHYYYALYRGSTDVSSPEEFVNSIYISTMANYYCRIFSGFNDNPKPIEERQYEIALSTLRSFDCFVVLENNNPFSELYNLLAWEKKDVKANQTRLDIISAVRLLAKGKLRLLLRHITHPFKRPNEEFTELFKEKNFWDYRLYKTLKEDW
ncbi:hypothetical protein OAC89_05470 [Deltaproteobacteria bacterium]|nr:hypothetical protein [Deltaproteobacteria bacterium]